MSALTRTAATASTIEYLRPVDGATIRIEETMTAGVMRQRVKPPVETLLSRNLITRRQYDAATMLYADYALGVCGAREIPDMPFGVRMSNPIGLAAAQLDALTNYRRACQAMSPPLRAVVIAVACEDKTVEDAGKCLGENRHGAAALLRAGLTELANHYGLTDRD